MALNIENWSPWAIDFIMENENIADLYENQNFPFSLGALFSDKELTYELEKAKAEGDLSYGMIVTAGGIDQLRDSLGVSADDYYQYVSDWKEKAREGNEALIASGASERYELDPTPWDEITATDEKLQSYFKKVYDREQAFETAKTEQWSQRKSEVETAYAQAVEDIDTLNEMIPLREESRAMAEEDTDRYINQVTQRLKLRGVASQFNDEDRQQLIQERFSDYWSEANDTLYTELYSQYGDPSQYSIDEEFGIMRGDEVFAPSTIVPYEEYLYEEEEEDASLLGTTNRSLL